jgi:hypothetical protein
MAGFGFIYSLEHEDGTSADPPTFHTAVPNWQRTGGLRGKGEGDDQGQAGSQVLSPVWRLARG